MIRSSRTLIRPIMETDEPDLYDIYRRPEVFEHFGSGPYSRERHIASVDRSVRKWQEYGHGDLVALHNGTPHNDATHNNATHNKKVIARLIIYPDKSDDYEVGYTLHPDYWGQGLASEIAKSLIEYAFHEGASHVLACARESNNASLAIIRKLGFEQTKKSLDDDGIMRIWHKVTKEQWQHPKIDLAIT